jgi:hypothetical protein
MLSLSPVRGPLGVQFLNSDVSLTASGAVVKGEIVQLSQSGANTSDTLVFDQCAPAGDNAEDDVEILYGVALEDAAVNAAVLVRLAGRVEADTGGSVADGDRCVVNSSGAHLITCPAEGTDPTKSRKIVAIAMDDDTSGNKVECLFDGINGFGTNVNATA